MLFADDIVLVEQSREELLENNGLKVNRQKTEYLECNVEQGGDLFVQDQKLLKVNAFKYLGSYLTKDGGLERICLTMVVFLGCVEHEAREVQDIGIRYIF